MRRSAGNAPFVWAFPRCGCALPAEGIFTFSSKGSCASPGGCPGMCSPVCGAAAAGVDMGLLDGFGLGCGSRRVERVMGMKFTGFSRVLWRMARDIHLDGSFLYRGVCCGVCWRRWVESISPGVPLNGFYIDLEYEPHKKQLLI
ncbi:hypothetical protein R3P38DRAFT_2850011 [Favolaschia claudopus]|uniref:Uncharacterized protein n=1 Tax=Favolaschia claudopus TaxID=2862362 RepID=A0AAW0DXG4_9AGAR